MTTRARLAPRGRFAEVYEDATVALPLVAGAVLERLGHFRRGRNAHHKVGATRKKNRGTDRPR